METILRSMLPKLYNLEKKKKNKRPRTINTINLEDQANGEVNSDYHLRQGICMQLISSWSRKTMNVKDDESDLFLWRDVY